MDWLIGWLTLAGVVAIVAGSKGFNWFGWFLYGLLIWPIALVHAIVARRASPRDPIPVVITEGLIARPAAHSIRDPMPSATSAAPKLKTCPMCAEQVQAAARICRFCRHEFPPEPATPSETSPTQEGRGGHIPFGTKACRNCGELNWHDAFKCKSCGTALRVSGA